MLFQTIQKNGFKFYVNNNKKFWKKYHEWNPETFSILQQYLKKDKCYIDIGAWIGNTCIIGSFLSKFCYAVEPNQFSYRALINNIRLNNISNIQVNNVYIGNSTTTIDVSSANDTRIKKIIQSITLDNYIEQYNISNCNFIKIDIDGGEVFLLPTIFESIHALNYPTLFVSFHKRKDCAYTATDINLYTESIKRLYKIYPLITNHMYQHISLEECLKVSSGSSYGTLLFTKV